MRCVQIYFIIVELACVLAFLFRVLSRIILEAHHRERIVSTPKSIGKITYDTPTICEVKQTRPSLFIISSTLREKSIKIDFRNNSGVHTLSAFLLCEQKSVI